MFNRQLSTEGRKIKRAFYDGLVESGANHYYAIIAAEAMALEAEDSTYHRTDYDRKAIHDCWQKITARNE